MINSASALNERGADVAHVDHHHVVTCVNEQISKRVWKLEEPAHLLLTDAILRFLARTI